MSLPLTPAETPSGVNTDLGDSNVAREIASLLGRGESILLKDGGRRIAWKKFGDGPLLVLLHGGHGSWLHWVRNIDALARGHSVLLVDMPGFGDSDDARDNTIEALVEPLLGTLAHLIGQARFDLAGFSFGGLVATHLAAACTRVRSLFLLAPAGHGTKRRDKAKLQRWQAATSRDQLLRMLQDNLAAHMFHEPAQIDAMALQAHAWSCARTRYNSRIVALRGGLLPLLQSLDIPSLALWGCHDVTADPQTLSPAVAALRPGIATRLLQLSGHWAQYEAAPAVDEIVAQWLLRLNQFDFAR